MDLPPWVFTANLVPLSRSFVGWALPTGCTDNRAKFSGGRCPPYELTKVVLSPVWLNGPADGLTDGEMEVTRQATQELMVSGGFSLDTKEQVRQAIDIVDLVGNYVQLRRQGRGYVGLCPWHDDTRPSLQVNPERQSWKCWGL